MFDASANLARREIIAGVLSGMRFIHDQGFIHHDLKVGSLALTSGFFVNCTVVPCGL
jgi:hypothetical protein